MWCIQDGAAGPRSLTKTISKIVKPRNASTDTTPSCDFRRGSHCAPVPELPPESTLTHAPRERIPGGDAKLGFVSRWEAYSIRTREGILRLAPDPGRSPEAAAIRMPNQAAARTTRKPATIVAARS